MVEYYNKLEEIKAKGDELYMNNKEWIDVELLDNNRFLEQLNNYKAQRNRNIALTLLEKMGVEESDVENGLVQYFRHDIDYVEEAIETINKALKGNHTEKLYRELCKMDAYISIQEVDR